MASSLSSATRNRLAIVGGAALVITAASYLGYRHWRKSSTSSTTPVATVATTSTSTLTAPTPVTPVVAAIPVTTATTPATATAAVTPPATAPAAATAATTPAVEEKTTATPATTTEATAASKPRRIVYIMRGVPGSGKSTLAKQLLADAPAAGEGNDGAIFSTDDFFSQSGEYKFNPKLLGEAHQWNQARAVAAMEAQRSPVIIDNTNTQRWEARGYVEAALKNGYEVLVREPNTPWKRDAEELAKRNTHGVEKKGIIGMLSRWDRDYSIEAILTSERPVFNPKQGSGAPGKRGPGKSPAVTPQVATTTPPPSALDAKAAPFVPADST